MDVRRFGQMQWEPIAALTNVEYTNVIPNVLWLLWSQSLTSRKKIMPAIESKPKPKHKIPEQAERGGKPLQKLQASVSSVSNPPIKKKVKSAEREVVYPKPGAILYAKDSSKGPMTLEVAKEMLLKIVTYMGL